jgi:hypothetical protein
MWFRVNRILRKGGPQGLHVLKVWGGCLQNPTKSYTGRFGLMLAGGKEKGGGHPYSTHKSKPYWFPSAVLECEYKPCLSGVCEGGGEGSHCNDGS